MTSHRDLHFVVQFADGSIWDSLTDNDGFRRNYYTNPKTLADKPLTSFKNEFMPGPDSMTAGEIKEAFNAWLDQHNAQPFKIKWKYL